MTEEIEVPVRAEIPLSKYLARIPKALFLKARSHCDRKGISLNTLITIALRDYLDAGDIDVPTQPKLSQVFKDELAALEARLMAVLDPQGLRKVHSVEVTIDSSHPGWPGLERFMYAAPSGCSAHAGGEGAILEPDEKVIGSPAVEDGLLTKTHLTVPGSLEWDSPVPQQQLWPDNPPVNGLAPEPLKGQVWVVTGDFYTMTTSRAREILQQAGAVVSTTVNKKTSAVLAGNSGESEKLDTAEARMLPIWTELQFLHMAKFIGADVRIPV